MKMYTEIDYYYDGNLCAVICPKCINQYRIDNADYTELDAIDGVKFWEGAPMRCDICNRTIESEYGDPQAEEQALEEAFDIPKGDTK